MTEQVKHSIEANFDVAPSPILAGSSQSALRAGIRIRILGISSSPQRTNFRRRKDDQPYSSPQAPSNPPTKKVDIVDCPRGACSVSIVVGMTVDVVAGTGVEGIEKDDKLRISDIAALSNAPKRFMRMYCARYERM